MHRWWSFVVLVPIVLGCGSAKDRPPVDPPSMSTCPTEGLAVGVHCAATVSGEASYSLSLPPGRYVLVTVASTGGALHVNAAYVGESLVDTVDAPGALALYNPTASPQAARITLAAAGARADIAVTDDELSPSSVCDHDCAKLMALPLPHQSDPFRRVSPPGYQWGRRETVQAIMGLAQAMTTAHPELTPLGLMDFSQRDGAVPGTDIMGPRHTYPAHTQGYAVDIAYYRANGDNSGKPACPSADGAVCSGPPHDLALPLNVAFFLGLARNPRLIQLVVDPVMEADLRAEIDRQLAAGTADALAAARVKRVLLSAQDEIGHANHFHAAFVRDPIAVSSLGSKHQAAESALAVGPSGDVMTAFMLLDDENAMGYAYSRNYGADWSDTQLLRVPPGHVVADPTMTVDGDGNFYLVWISHQLPPAPSDSHLYFAKASAGAGQFAAPTEVSDPAEDFIYDRPGIQLSELGAPLVAYARGPANGEQLDSVLLAAFDGQRWTRTLIAGGIGAPAAAYAYLCVPHFAGRVYVAHRDGGQVALRWSEDNGQTWPSANRSVVFDGATTADPKCVAIDSDVWVLDARAKEFPPAGAPLLSALVLRHSADHGQSFDPVIEVQDTAAGSVFMLPGLSLDGRGALSVTYYAGARNGDPAGSFRVSRASDRAASQFWPSVIVRSGIAIHTGFGLAWMGDYTGAMDTQGSLFMSFADEAGDASQTLVYRLALP